MASDADDVTRALLAGNRDDPAEYAEIGRPTKATAGWNRLNRVLTRTMPTDLRRGRKALERIRSGR